MSLLPKLKSNFFKTLGHPIRIQILNLLKEEELCVCDIQEILDQSQSNISQHLAKLKNNQLVKSKREGLQIRYSLKDEGVIEILNLAQEILLKQLEESQKELTNN